MHWWIKRLPYNRPAEVDYIVSLHCNVQLKCGSCMCSLVRIEKRRFANDTMGELEDDHAGKERSKHQGDYS